MTRKRKDYRELKVSSFSGYGYKSAPMLRIQGLWLEELGFNIIKDKKYKSNRHLFLEKRD